MRLRQFEKRIDKVGDRNGFSVFEVIAALTVLSIGLVVLFESQNTGLKSIAMAANYNKARLIAESLMADATSGWKNQLKNEQGRTDIFDWSISISPARGDWATVGRNTRWQLARVSVRVEWESSRRFQMDTLKLLKKTQTRP